MYKTYSHSNFLIKCQDSPFGNQDCNFYVSKNDPLFDEFHEACKEQLKWKNEGYSHSVLRMEYCDKDEVEKNTKERGCNYRCEGGFLSEDNLVKEIVHPKDVVIEEQKRKIYKIRKFGQFGDVIGKDFFGTVRMLSVLRLKF